MEELKRAREIPEREVAGGRADTVGRRGDEMPKKETSERDNEMPER
ncbi:MAG: hypothetical protein HFH91_16065 [Lachnospiraceae bacterium]|nr:hypothetical protein [Lachnospiraceae bacterium]